MHVTYRLELLRPNSVKETYPVPSIPPYCKGQKIFIKHLNPGEVLDDPEDNTEYFIIDDLFHDIKTSRLDGGEVLTELALVVWLKLPD